MAYNHGVRVLETPTSITAPILGTAGLQVAFGISPVNRAEDPYNATNVVKIAYSFAEAAAAVGYSNNLNDYNLNQSISATFKKFAVAPLVLINVLDPKKHKIAVQKEEYTVKDLQVIIETEGLLLDKLEVENGETKLKVDEDYVTSFDDNGYAVITLLGTRLFIKNPYFKPFF